MRKRSSRGFTLTEILVAVAIFAIIFVAALLIYDRSNRVFKNGVESADLQQNTRVAFDKMVSDLRMAGFDHDRDGSPTVAGQSQQPDEQIEYAGPSAVTIRANFNFEDEATDGGRITALETSSQFPVVTTANDEIVTYVLRSEDNSKNTDTLTFFADVTDGTAEARQTYPGGEAEDQVTIANVDLCDDGNGCENPPYTLYRATLDDDGTAVMTPLASNIRSMTVDYFSDSVGQTALAVTNPGGGQYDPSNPSASAAARAVRARIRSMRVNIIGMNEQSDASYTDPAETIASVDNFRKFELESLVVARNLGRQGMKETVEQAPGKPTLDSVCFGYCAGVKLSWTAPASTTSGAVEGYIVLWDTDTSNVTDPPANAQNVGYATSFYLAGLDADTAYRFSIAATNSYGTTFSDQYVVGTPQNTTTMSPPTGLVATDSTSPVANMVQLAWTAPTTNASGVVTCLAPNGSTSSSSVAPETQERKGYEVWRSTVANFNTSTGSKIATTSSTAENYNDTSAANCQTYFYRIRVAEHCIANPGTENVSPAEPWSTFETAIGGSGVEGWAESSVKPKAPTTLQVLSDTCSSGSCTVNLSWPKVTQDVDGTAVAIAEYLIEGEYDDGAGNISAITSQTVTSSNGTFGASAVQYPLVVPDPGAGQYFLTVKARQCSVTGDASPQAKYPSCTFASGGAISAVASPNSAGSGSDVSPYEVIGSGTIGVGTTTNATLTEVSAQAYVVSGGGLFADLGTKTGSFTTASFSWPGGSDGETYRVDITAKDASGCSSFVSIYLTQVTVSCPFVTPLGITVNSSNVVFSLKNTTAFDVDITSIAFTWDQNNAPIKNPGKTSEAKSTVSTVFMPDAPSTVSVTTSGSKSASGTFTATPGSAVDDLFANDTSGNYKVTVNFNVPSGNPDGDLVGAITGVTINYTVAGTPSSCVVYP